MHGQPSRSMLEQVRDIPIYHDSLARGHLPILEKSDIADGFPDNWTTPRLTEALAGGAAEIVLSTGTNHARMQLIRPPYFLLRSYYQLWAAHPDIAHTWADGCQRVSLTTNLATEHVARVNARKNGTDPSPNPALADRWLDERTVYVNLALDPALWDRADVERILDEIEMVAGYHPDRAYHLDCSSYYLAHLADKVSRWNLWHRLPAPASIVHAYEFTPNNVARFLRQYFDCPIIDLFGSTELGYLYYSDRAGDYHPFLDQMNIELLPVVDGSTLYSIVVTSLRNPYMPLIRYRSGDCARTVDGTPDPNRIARFCGREKELIRLEGSAEPVCHGDLDEWLSEVTSDVFTYQLSVDGRTSRLRYTTFDGAAIDQPTVARLRERISARTGLDCDITHHEHIAIGRSGKYAWLAKSQGNDR